MRLAMSFRTRRELLIQIIPRYREAGRSQKKSILDEFVASKRLAPFLKELIPALERHGHLKLEDKGREIITFISAATIDRILRAHRNIQQGRGLSTTKSGTLLKKQISVRTFADWKDERPGFFEADLVAHCGTNMGGSFLYSFVLTDVATGWVECLPLLSRHQGSVI